MRDGDDYDVCCTCGTEKLVRAMRQVGFDPPGLYQCERCFDDTHLTPDEFEERWGHVDDYESGECPHCGGTGEQAAGGLATDCPECGGYGDEC